MMTLRAVISKMFFPSLSTCESPPRAGAFRVCAAGPGRRYCGEGHRAGSPGHVDGASPGAGPHEHNDPPGDQSREALQVKMSRPTMGPDTCGRNMSDDTLWAVHNSIVGTPDTSIQQLTELSEHLHPGSRPLYGHAGPMPHRDVRSSIAWFGRAGVPALHAVALPPYASATAPFPGAPARTRQGCAGGQPRPARWGTIAS